MSRSIWSGIALIPLFVAAVGCAPAGTSSDAQRPSESRSSRTVVVVYRSQTTSLAAKPLRGDAGTIASGSQFFNASLDTRDEAGEPTPRLAEGLPQLHTDSWRVFPDGRMETAYRLKPNLTWHDGATFTAEDFVFAWQVYATPAFGTNAAPISFMEQVLAPDPRTLVIRWREPYPEAGVLEAAGFPPLPRHVLETSFQDLSADVFVGLPFWVGDYIGLGPYKVDRLEHGAFIDGTAFDGYVLGRPKIDKVRLTFIADTNTVMANMLAGEAHFVTDFLIGTEEARTLEHEWAKRGSAGVINESPTQMRMTGFQFRPDAVNPPLLRDVRVRKGLAHAIDTQSALDAMTYGKGKIVPVPIPENHDYWRAVEGIPTYNYDPLAARRLLAEAGLVRVPDGLYQIAGGGPFRLEYGFIQQAANERENAIFVDSLRRNGVDAVPRAYTALELRDPEKRNLYPALFTGTGTRLTELTIEEITAPENRWQGRNRVGWESEEFSQLRRIFQVTLEPAERTRLISSMARIFYEELPGIPHYLTTVVNAWSPDLVKVVGRSNPNIQPLEHVHNWEWRS